MGNFLAGDWGRTPIDLRHVDVLDFRLPAGKFFVYQERLYPRSHLVYSERDANADPSKFMYHQGRIYRGPVGTDGTPIRFLPATRGRVNSGPIQTSPGWHYPHLYAELEGVQGCVNVDRIYDFRAWNGRYITDYDVDLCMPLSSTKIRLAV